MQLTRSQLLWIFLAAVGLMRLVSLSMYPLMDTTEARYGEMARIMLETDNWVTPQIDYDIPFWGKPPLFTWASALSIAVLGNSEFSLRLPHFLSAVVILILLWQFVNHLTLSRIRASYAVAVVASTVGFLLAAGVIMTDMLLSLSMTMTMIGFWRGWHGERVYNIMLYAGLGIGLLAKGPLIIVLVGLALFPWLVLETGIIHMWRQIWRRMNILSGLSFMLLISAPWYILAEQATPGFLQYFLVGEHFQRFVDSGWQGDLYGAGHARARGTIWIYWLLFALPWSPLLIWAGIRHFFSGNNSEGAATGLNFFLLLWMLSPLILFTLAGNILPAYVLPGLPATGLLMVLNYDFLQLKKGQLLFLVGPLIMLFTAGTVILSLDQKYSDKKLLESAADSTHPIYYYQYRPYSAQYYSNGKAQVVELLPDDKNYYLAIKKQTIPEEAEKNCQLKAENGPRALYFCQYGHY